MPALDWKQRTEEAARRLDKISHMQLSMFGRASTATAYGTHMATYHMEHSGLPPPETLAAWEAAVAKLVDRSQGPSQHDRRLTGVPARLLPGHPVSGGFGSLPLQQHIYARWAKRAATYASGDGTTRPVAAQAPWQRVFGQLLRSYHPCFRPMALLTARTNGPWLGTTSLPPGRTVQTKWNLRDGAPCMTVQHAVHARLGARRLDVYDSDE
ncbi:hypothetical protein CHLRE_05g241649v5 [Chlamydomonas reinhardtii]|uniref:Uncharacterized protein n=1 Tax=Chlamydomonas reinhardtii TaxID=3055 RepID=A8JE16_CHLRE|nr:uncharacterized protein CHLRE_05g241647v5 [Chlamydomonas reinhardtii]XP_042924756.1 uncharacterized protein CHLRE_05g241649v5 [Chlamydomonas reinhardtii]PNW83507.1 hypothetical protein CHLRE_05g241647v5 [Chlamydomonas reinhardtii]PNW83509.1 hypothetical protein CHLRE_05g241649v5 [Chlamydomonas reinhardtii]|eukprot:XP_001700663.1 hypothetical protein CHLREDRAFT_153482 [Chlamydomonas reinhardtii]